MSVNGIRNAKSYINRQGEKLGKNFQKEIINRSRTLSKKIQKDLVDSVDRGAVAFTNRAVLFLYKKTSSGVKTTIMIRQIQAHYLYDVIVKPDAIEKFIPTSKARLSKQGNIAGLHRNLKTGRFKIVKQGNKERLIDTKAKKREKRVIGLREKKTRKMIYDFYEEADKGTRMIISTIRGVFKVTKQ